MSSMKLFSDCLLSKVRQTKYYIVSTEEVQCEQHVIRASVSTPHVLWHNTECRSPMFKQHQETNTFTVALLKKQNKMDLKGENMLLFTCTQVQCEDKAFNNCPML